MSSLGEAETAADARDASAERVAGGTGLPFPGWQRYEVLRELGRGGMGIVYEARDLRLGRLVALKFIRGADPRATLRLVQEARAQACVDHPHVGKIFEVGEVDGRAYIAMQLVDGRPLGEVAARASLRDKVAIVRDVARALHEAHTFGVLHRDVKPGNILVEVTRDGRFHPLVMDFGLARQETEEHGLTQSGAVLGTPAYMSPEQARGEHGRLDSRSDVYGLGATLYELLGGTPPFGAAAPAEVLVAVLQREPLSLRARVPSLPADLETITTKCLAKERERRYESARALADDLDRYLRGEPILGRKATLRYRLRRRARRNPALVVTAALSLMLLLVVGTLGIRARLQTIASEARARRSDELTRDVKEIEWFLRTAYLLPAHDLTVERARVRERMALIAERAGGEALADYALGRGHLALGEDGPARELLDRALAAGLDAPELHYARGLVLARLYDQEVAKARRSGQGAWLAQRLRDIEVATLRPALAALEKSRGARLEAPSYLDGVIAYYRKDYPLAIAMARLARVQAPWLYAGMQLEADAYRARGLARSLIDDDAAALDDLDAAARLYDEALVTGRSDVDLYLDRVEVFNLRARITRAAATLPDSLDRAEAWCRTATLISPRSTRPLLQLAGARLYMGYRGEDPLSLYRGAVDAAKAAAAIDARAVEPYLIVGTALQQEAWYLLRHDLDPRAAIVESIAQFQMALAIDPRQPTPVAGLGNASYALGLYLQERGEDPVAAYRSAAEQISAAVRLDPDLARRSSEMSVYSSWAEFLYSRGRDPRSLAPAVAHAFAACLRETRGAGHCYDSAGEFHAVLAAYQIEAGIDARAQLDHLDLLLAKDDRWNGLPALVSLLRIRAAVRDAGDEVGPHAAFARNLAAYYQIRPGNAWAMRLEAEEALLLAKTRGDLLRARTLAAAAVEGAPRSSEVVQLLAEAELRLGHIDAGLAACGRDLANPNDAHLLATCGALRVRQAMATGSAAIARDAGDSVARAIALNPLLASRYRSVADEAGRLPETLGHR